MLISISQLKTNPGKYIALAGKETVYITKKGKKVAKITATTTDRIASAKQLFGILPPDTDLDKARSERLKC